MTHPDLSSAPPPEPAIEPIPASWSRSWLAVVLASTIAVIVVSVVGGPEVVRAPITVWFIAFCPGMAVVRLLRIDDAVAEVMLAFALSFALAGLVPGVFLYLGAWSPGWSLAVLVVITVVGLAFGPVPATSWQSRRAGGGARLPLSAALRQAHPNRGTWRPVATGERSGRGPGVAAAPPALTIRRLPSQARPRSAEERTRVRRTLGSDPLVAEGPTTALQSAFDRVIADIADRRRRGE